jgi:adenosylhomocysteine nucleosidase
MAEEFPDPLVAMALEIEAQGLFERAGVPVLFTGLGKINATFALTRRLAQYRHAGRAMPQVVNFGTAGSRHFPSSSLVACRTFVQRDMDVTGLGFERGTTPFEKIPPRLEFPVTFAGLPHGVCGTADSFETGAIALSCDVVDMEGYALAKVCWQEGAHFACAKFVTDGADATAATSWQENLPGAAAEFLRLYRSLVEPI